MSELRRARAAVSELALRCCECLQVLDTLEDADAHLENDEWCGRANGYFEIVTRQEART